MKKRCLASAAVAALALALPASAAERFPKDYTYDVVGIRQDSRGVVRGTVTEVDSVKRTVTVQDATGASRQLRVHEKVTNLGQAKVTDDVALEYVRSFRIYKKAPGAKAPAKEVVAALEQDVWKTGAGEVLAVAGTGTATVESVDAATRTVTFRGSDGRAYRAPVEDPVLLKGIAPGQTYDLDTYEAVATAMDVKARPPPPPPPPPPAPVVTAKAKLVEKKIEVTEVVYFAVNKADIDPKSFDLLNDVATIMKGNPQVRKVRVEGNASKDPMSAKRKDGAEYNRKLSQARADSVKAYLVKQGVAADRLETVGNGWERPVAPNDTKEGRAKNRRTDFVVLDQ